MCGDFTEETFALFLIFDRVQKTNFFDPRNDDCCKTGAVTTEGTTKSSDFILPWCHVSRSIVLRIGVARGFKGSCPSKFLENIVILCFQRRFFKQNIVIRLKSNILSPPNLWAVYATGSTYCVSKREVLWYSFCRQPRMRRMKDVKPKVKI